MPPKRNKRAPLTVNRRILCTLSFHSGVLLCSLPVTAEARATPNWVSPTLPPPPKNGLYVPIQGNEPSICPQEIRVQTLHSKHLARIRVAYTGDCGYMGPYWYRCLLLTEEETGAAPKWLCGEDAIWFRFFNERRYEWKNLTYHFEAIFEPSL